MKIGGVMDWLVRHRSWRLARELMLVFGLDMPAQVKIGQGLRLEHRGMGTVVHPATIIGDDVTLYHQVTIGRADAHIPWEESSMERIEIGAGAVLFPGAKVLGGTGVTRVGNGTIIAANAVLLSSTGDNEVWGGIPARKIGNARSLRLAGASE